MARTLRDDYYDEMADFIRGVYLTFCLQAGKRPMSGTEIALFNRAARINVRLWGSLTASPSAGDSHRLRSG